MKKTAKYLSLSALLLVISILYVVLGANGELKPYYSGDAVYSNGRLIFGSVNNDGVLELFEYSNNAIVKGSVIRSKSNLLPVNVKPRISDFALVTDGGRVYAFTVEGAKMSKYDITNLGAPVLVDQVVDKSGDWYIGMEKYGNRLATIGAKELKLWNYSMQNIDSLKIFNKQTYKVDISEDGKYIFNIGTDSVNFFDTISRNYTYNLGIKTNNAHNRKSFYDTAMQRLFVVDDEKVNSSAINGTLLDSFKHISNNGYDVDAVQGGSYLYMTDGLGVVKLNKLTLDVAKSAPTVSIGSKKGGWAMGLNVVKTDNGEKLVIFNNSNILVMDSDLKVLGSVNAVEGSNVAFVEEPLSLKLDKTVGVATMPVLLSGTGFSYNEDLTITFANQIFLAKADKDGRLKTTLITPSVLPGRKDIKVTGNVSKLTYSITFDIR